MWHFRVRKLHQKTNVVFKCHGLVNMLVITQAFRLTKQRNGNILQIL